MYNISILYFLPLDYKRYAVLKTVHTKLYIYSNCSHIKNFSDRGTILNGWLSSTVLFRWQHQHLVNWVNTITDMSEKDMNTDMFSRIVVLNPETTRLLKIHRTSRTHIITLPYTYIYIYTHSFPNKLSHTLPVQHLRGY